MKTVLIVHDISGYGTASTTVALPILSAMGIKGVLLPTALLSTHTGPQFEGFTFLDLTEEMKKMISHWKSLELRFDAIYVGYLGSIEQIQILEDQGPGLLKEGGKLYLDPVMADHGHFYSGFDQAYADELVHLADQADLLMPNYTELAFLADLPQKKDPVTARDLQALTKGLNRWQDQDLVVTGIVSKDQAFIGSAYRRGQTADTGFHQAPFIPGLYPGTGDIFASILVGALMNDKSLDTSVSFATQAVSEILAQAPKDMDLAFEGIPFEQYLGQLYDFAHGPSKK